MSNVKWSIIIAAAFFCAASRAQQGGRGIALLQPRADTGRVFGVVIGVSSYASLPSLGYADADAYNFWSYLRRMYPGQDTGNISLFLNKAATYSAIVEKLYDINDRCRPGDRVFVYFAGHGDVEQSIHSDQCLLLLSGIPSRDYLKKPEEFLSFQTTFAEFFTNWAAKEVKTVLVCDACHSGLLAGGEPGRKNVLLSLQETWKNDVKILSCQPGEVSVESPDWGGGRGLFSYYFVLGMDGLADADRDGKVTLFELQRFLQDNVSERSGRRQMPVVSGDLGFALAGVRPELLAEGERQAGLSVALGSNFAATLSHRKGEKTARAAVLAFRGAGAAEDSVAERVYGLFLEKLQNGRLLEPEGDCARRCIDLLHGDSQYAPLKRKMSIELITRLEAGFDVLLANIYAERYPSMGFEEKLVIERALGACLSLAKGMPQIAARVEAKLLFMQACELSVDLRPGAQSAYEFEQLEKGLDLLARAIRLSPLSPHLYLREGDYLLYTNRFEEAVKAYTQFQQLLPNDEFAWNKLGLAYMADKKYGDAAAAFRRAVALNPAFGQARDNLSIAERHL